MTARDHAHELYLAGAQRVMNFALTQMIDLGVILGVRKYLV